MNFNGIPAADAFALRSGVNCIVVGDAPCKHEDYAAALRMAPTAHVCILNDSKRDMDGIEEQMTVTMHGAVNNFIGTHRMPLSRISDDSTVISYVCGGDEHERVDAVYSCDSVWGTCALFGVLSAFYHGYDSVILAGCPMLGAYGSESKLGSWQPWLPHLIGRVSSLSGNTMKMFKEADRG